MGHSTWDTYTAMTKVFKHYDFNLALPGIAAQSMSFSSYPGEMFSDDDLCEPRKSNNCFQYIWEVEGLVCNPQKHKFKWNLCPKNC